MGIAADLGYRFEGQSGLQRAMSRAGTPDPVAAFLNRVFPAIDRWVLRLTSGRSTMTSWTTGLPTLWVTTTGRKSGLPRTVPLLGIPHGEDLALMGTHFGQKGTPEWVLNIEANPAVDLRYRDATRSAVARRAAAEEEPGLWEAAARLYPGYRLYGQRVTDRVIRVFVLEAG